MYKEMRQEFSLWHPLVELLIDLILVYIIFLHWNFLLILIILVRKHLQIKNDVFLWT